METMLAGMLGAMLIFAAIVSPLTLLKQMKSYGNNISHQQSVLNILTFINMDLNEADGRVRYDGEYLIISGSAYSFTDEGTYREVLGDSKKISDAQLELTMYENAFQLTTPSSSSQKPISMFFNNKFSSFDKGGAP